MHMPPFCCRQSYAHYPWLALGCVTMRGRLPSVTAPVHISLMLAVEDAPSASNWYQRALGAVELWSLGSVVGLEVAGAPFFLHEPTSTGFDSPAAIGRTTVRVEVFVDDPDALIARAVAAGADGSADGVRDHDVPWGVHRQGGFRIRSATSGSSATSHHWSRTPETCMNAATSSISRQSSSSGSMAGTSAARSGRRRKRLALSRRARRIASDRLMPVASSCASAVTG